MSYIVRQLGVRKARVLLQGFLIGLLGGAAIPLLYALYQILQSNVLK